VRTDGQTVAREVNSRFRNFVNAPKNPQSNVHSSINDVAPTVLALRESVIFQEMFCEENSSQDWRRGVEPDLLISHKN
jgi:predicted secreted protein